MSSWGWIYLCVIVLTLVLPPPSFTTWHLYRGFTYAKIDPNDKGEPLFKEGHPNITYLTDDNYDAMMNNYSDKPWLVDFYHPFCPHCKHFVPTYEEIAAYYKIEGSIYLGAVSCMDHVKCRRVAIKGFPTLMAIGFDKKRPHQETKRVVGTHTFQEVIDFVNENFREAAFNETGTYPPTVAPVPRGPNDAKNPVVVDTEKGKEKEKEAVPGEQVRKEIWEESTKPMNQTTRLQDAASAFIFGLKQGIFMGREVLEDDELDALKAWLKLVSETFPGTINRKIILTLYQKIESLALLDFDRWDMILKTWQSESIDVFEQEELKLNWNQVDRATIPSWQRLSTLFVGQGNTYHACALYTCGQWNMFHMLTMNPFPDQRSDELMVSVIATMRRFMKHFFGCVQCRDHFLEYNTIEKVQEIQSASNKPLALKRWLWKMHNAVNTRIRHPVWPKPSICPTCGDESEWIEVEVDKWLGNTYVYQEVSIPPIVHLRTEAPKVESDQEKGDEKLEKELEQMMEKADSIAPTAPSQPKPKVNDVKEANLKQAGMDHAKLDALQDPKAPPVSLFTWYILPVAAVGAYLLFVRSRIKARTSFRHHARE